MKAQLIVGIIAFGLFCGSAYAQDSVCSTPGTAVFSSIPEDVNDIPPSVRREITGIGRLAHNGACAVVVTCVADPSLGAPGRASRNKSCFAVKNALGLFESRRSIRFRLSKTYELVRVNPGQELQAGKIYITLK